MAGRRSAPPSPQSSSDGGRITVPATVTDPVWSLHPWPLTITAAGALLEVPALPAADWLAILMASELELDDLFPGLLAASDQELVEEALLDGVISLDDCYQMVLDIISTVSGRPWWVAMRLIYVARDSWQVLGAELLLKGVDAQKLSLSGWLDVLLLTVMRNIDKDEATMFTLRLEQPPADIEVETKEPEMSASAFMSMA